MKKILPKPIEWFEMCLNNQKINLERSKEEFERTTEQFKNRIKNTEEEIKFREFQISEAKRLKKTEFNYNSFANEFYEKYKDENSS